MLSGGAVGTTESVDEREVTDPLSESEDDEVEEEVDVSSSEGDADRDRFVLAVLGGAFTLVLGFLAALPAGRLFADLFTATLSALDLVALAPAGVSAARGACPPPLTTSPRLVGFLVAWGGRTPPPTTSPRLEEETRLPPTPMPALCRAPETPVSLTLLKCAVNRFALGFSCVAFLTFVEYLLSSPMGKS